MGSLMGLFEEFDKGVQGLDIVVEKGLFKGSDDLFIWNFLENLKKVFHAFDFEFCEPGMKNSRSEFF